MGQDVHTIDQIAGSTFSLFDRILIGMQSAVVNPSSPGAIASVGSITAGSYATLPAASVSGDGTGATLVPVMKAISATIDNPGTGYVVTDTVTMTGGTETTNTILTVSELQLVSAAINAAGTLYLPGDQITLAGGTSTVKASVGVNTVKLISAALISPGTNYVVNDTITVAGGTHSTASILTVSTLQLAQKRAHP